MNRAEKAQSHTQLLVAIDVGNSRIKLGLFEKAPDIATDRQLPAYIQSMAVELDEEIPWHELALWATQSSGIISSIVLGGVNPRGRDKVLDGWPAMGWPDPVVIDNPFILPLTINVDQADNGGLNTSGPDGIGDVCQRADIDADGDVDMADDTVLRRKLADLPPGFDPAVPPQP